MEILDKIELLEKWWNDKEIVRYFTVSQTTNSIYIKFINNKGVRISDHNSTYSRYWININMNIWEIQNILLFLSGNKLKRKGVPHENILI